MRYKLRSSVKPQRQAAASTSSIAAANDDQMATESETENTALAPKRPCRQQRRKTAKSKSCHQLRKAKKHQSDVLGSPMDRDGGFVSDRRITDLPEDVILHVASFLDSQSLLSLFMTCGHFADLLGNCNAFWKLICAKEELVNYHCLHSDDDACEEELDDSRCCCCSDLLRDILPNEPAVIVEHFGDDKGNACRCSDHHPQSTSCSSSKSQSLRHNHRHSPQKKAKLSNAADLATAGEDSSEFSEEDAEHEDVFSTPQPPCTHHIHCKREARVPAQKQGWRGSPMHCTPPGHYPFWRRVFLKGLQMRRNIWQSNYEGWRIYANSNAPVVRLTPDLDLNEVKRKMGDFPKLSENDDLKIDWDDRHLVVFHFFRGEGESCVIRLWDISEEPTFKYQVDKGLECITDKVSVVNDHVAIVPSWPLEAKAIVMTLDINNEMAEVGKFIFEDRDRQNALDEQWEHTQLRVIKNEAMVVCRCPDWSLVVVDLPHCKPLYECKLDSVSSAFDCQQIRSYKQTAMVLFQRKANESANILVTVDISGAETRVRSCHTCNDVADVALFTDPEEIYIMKKNGDVVMYDATRQTETVKIANDECSPTGGAAAGILSASAAAAAAADVLAAPSNNGTPGLNEYQLFVNRKEQICVMQSASEVPQGRHIKVYTYAEQKLYTINLDLCRYGMSRDESICIYTNGAFLAAADSKRFTMFNVKTGAYLGSIMIPCHLERNKGKDEKDCMFEQTGLSLFIFDEDKLIAVHDYERSFPAVLDIYKFW